MSLVEFIGFVISMVAMAFLFIKKVYDERQRRLNPEKYAETERKKEQALQEFLKSLELERNEEEEEDEEEEEPVLIKPPPAPQMAKQHKVPFRSTLDHYKPVTLIEQRKIQTNIEKRRPFEAGDHLISDTFKIQSVTDPSYEVERLKIKSRGEKALEELSSRRQLFIIKEILDKPKGMLPPGEV